MFIAPHPSSSQTRATTHTRPSPLERDVGRFKSARPGDTGGRNKGGTHEMGGPRGASQKRATTFVVAHFPSPNSPTNHPSSECQHVEPHQDPKTPARPRTTTWRTQRPCERPDDHL